MRKVWAIAGGSTLVYIVLALMMAIIPGIELSKTPPGPGVKPLTALQSEGRAVYAANGCGYCHTQQVRPLAEDKPFGRPSAPGDFTYQTPELLGSERTGPDLTDVGVQQGSDVWQYMHLYNPRSVVPQSIMPSFSWLFRVVPKAPADVAAVPVPAAFAPAHGVVIPTPQAQALVAYLLSLRQAPIAGAAAAGSGAGTPASAPPQGAAMANTSSPSSAAGASLFSANCASCHQASGEGLPGAFPPLKANAAVNDSDPTLHIHTVLFGAHGLTVGGVAYASAMPPFGTQLNDQQVADLIDYERSAWGNHGRPVSTHEVAAVRALGH